MSYNTRRNTGYATTPPQAQHQTVGNIGQRRPVGGQGTTNFVQGGQLNPQQAKPGVQLPSPQQRPPQTPVKQQTTTPAPAAANTNFRNQPAQPPQQQPPVTMNPDPPASENTNGDSMDASIEEGQKKRPFWNKSGNKISKKEKVRRRNVRLSKMLQPKNAVMILNELVRNTSYMVDEVQSGTEDHHFKATVLVEGVEHAGVGHSKINAKNVAAETALKHLIKYNKLAEVGKDEEDNEKMEVSEDGAEPPLPWQHVASFAIFKLFSSWGEDPNAVKNQLNTQLNSSGGEKQQENKPAKKMPDNPETLNPLMLLNQMMPQAQFEEIGKSGIPPNVTYSYRCTVDGQSFIGTGPNKKAAKKLAAFGACHKVLKVSYSPDVYIPNY